jgi:hypothetical protein
MAMTTVDALGTDEFLDILNAEMLPRPDDRYIWDLMGCMKEYEAPKGVATSAVTDKKLLVNKPTFIGAGFSEAARRLTDGTDVGIGNPLGLDYDQFGIQVREYGGPYTAGGVNAVTPIGITEFTSERSLQNIAEEIGEKLRRDHVRWRNAVCRDLCLASTTVVLADSAAAEGNIVAGKGISWEFLRRLRKSLEDLLIPPFPNGQYRYAIGTNDEANLYLDADVKDALKRRPELDEAFKVGYIGSVLGFDFVVDTTMPTKAVGAGGAVTGYQGVAHGAIPCIGHSTALAPQARRSELTDYGRKGLFIWKSHEGWGTLDLNNVCVRTITT